LSPLIPHAGNYKKKFGVKRERAPFIFTPQFSDILGGKKSPHFKNFIHVCCHVHILLILCVCVFFF
jgi:phosphatidylinositol-4,5-bisphosphate 3-kinase